MSPPRSFDDVSGRVADLAPVFRQPLDSPYEISNELYDALRHVLHDVGGQIDLPLPFKEKVEEEWEMNTYVTCECLGWRGAWNSEERRRAGTPSDYTYFYVLENTPEVHNVIVCTLCSCYPRPVLGMSPDWYRTPNYRRRLGRWPREVLAEFGLHFGPDVEVRVHDSNQKVTVHGHADATRGHRGLDRGATRGDHHPRHHDRCCSAASGLDRIRTAVRREGQRVNNGPYEVLLDTLDPEARRESALPELERRADPWESGIQATCECLSWRGALDNLERRHAEDALGETTYHDFPVHELMDRGTFTPEELRARMDAVRERFNRE
jgi:hypothetical protein